MSQGPDIGALLAQMQGGQGPAGPAGPPAPEGDLGGEEGGGSTTDILSQMIDLAKEYLDVETDQEDIHTMTGILQKLQQYLASEQKEQDDAMQGKASPKLMRKTYGAGG